MERMHCGGRTGPKIEKKVPTGCDVTYPLPLSWPCAPRLPRPRELLGFSLHARTSLPRAPSSRRGRTSGPPALLAPLLTPREWFRELGGGGGSRLRGPEGFSRFYTPCAQSRSGNGHPSAARALRPHRSKGILEVSNIAARTEGWANSAERAGGRHSYQLLRDFSLCSRTE